MDPQPLLDEDGDGLVVCVRVLSKNSVDDRNNLAGSAPQQAPAVGRVRRRARRPVRKCEPDLLDRGVVDQAQLGVAAVSRLK